MEELRSILLGLCWLQQNLWNNRVLRDLFLIVEQNFKQNPSIENWSQVFQSENYTSPNNGCVQHCSCTKNCFSFIKSPQITSDQETKSRCLFFKTASGGTWINFPKKRQFWNVIGSINQETLTAIRHQYKAAVQKKKFPFINFEIYMMR